MTICKTIRNYCKYDMLLIFIKVRELDTTMTVKGDEDGIVALCLEVIRGGHSVLIFCPTKNWCEQLSNTIAKEFYGLRHGKNQQQKRMIYIVIHLNSCTIFVAKLT